MNIKHQRNSKEDQGNKNRSFIKPYLEEASNSYDQTRFPIGLKVIEEYLINKYCKDSTNNNDLNAFKNLKIGDFPCGTGNYSIEIAKKGAYMYLIDGSIGMLKQSEKKLDGLKLKYFSKGCYLDSNEFDDQIIDDSLDVIICCQFIHHVIKDKSLKRVDRIFSLFFKKLKNDGVLIVDFSSDEQVELAFWTRSFFPKNVLDKELSHFVNEKSVIELLERIGFELKKKFLNKNSLQKDYYNLDIADEKVRHGDSGFNFFSKNELDNMLKKYKSVSDNELKEIQKKSKKWVDESENGGFCTILFCHKKVK